MSIRYTMLAKNKYMIIAGNKHLLNFFLAVHFWHIHTSAFTYVLLVHDFKFRLWVDIQGFCSYDCLWITSSEDSTSTSGIISHILFQFSETIKSSQRIEVRHFVYFRESEEELATRPMFKSFYFLSRHLEFTPNMYISNNDIYSNTVAVKNKKEVSSFCVVIFE